MAFEDPLQEFSFEERRPLLDMLEPGEEILWADRPEMTAAFGRSSIGVLFGIGWSALIIYFFFFQGAHNPPPWIAIPFLLAGAMIFLAPLRRMRKVKKTFYALTDQRALIFEPGRTRVFDVNREMQFDLRESGGGQGDIVFNQWQEIGMRAEPASSNSPKGANKRMRKIGFLDIDHVRRPHQLLQQLTS